MSINTIEYAKVFMSALDKQIIEGSTTGWMEANASQVKYNGGNEVKIPKISMSGLGKYDRDTGFVQGSVTLNFETMTLSQDRGRTFQIDAMDVDESNFSAIAGEVMGEFQRTQVIPEIDAYRYSAIAKAAKDGGKSANYTPAVDSILAQLMGDIAKVQDVAGDSAELIISMPVPVAIILDQAKDIAKFSDVSDFKQGDKNFKVKTLNGIPIIRVPSSRMKSEFDFKDGVSDNDGGFEATEGAVDINWIIAVKSAPIAISKTDVTRIFDPITNQKANAWKIDYRKYHDIWLTKNALDGIFVSLKDE